MVKIYPLGHSESELRRLETQAKLIDPITRSFFESAGIAKGMRVLDIGSGVGDVAFAVARVVGENGAVIGTDKSSTALQTAHTRAGALGLTNVSFVEGDPAELEFDRPFDAIVGRYILMFINEPAKFLRSLLKHLRPNGIVVFHEPDWRSARSSPPASLYNQCCYWCAEAIQRQGSDIHMGSKLHRLFIDAGLPAPTMQLQSLIGAGEQSADAVRLITDLVGTLTDDIEALGIESRENINITSLHDRVLAQVIETGSTVFGRAEIGAWSAHR